MAFRKTLFSLAFIDCEVKLIHFERMQWLIKSRGYDMKIVTKRLIGLLSVALFLVFCQGEVFGQEVSGVVRDQQSDKVLPGVNIVVKGTTHGTTTDSDGNYQLSVSSTADTLMFSYIGYKSKAVPINGRTTLNVSLQPSVIKGQEMVVVGYGQQRETQVTGAIGRVQSDELEKTPSVASSDAVVGKVSGISFRKADARPGSGTSLQIRNMGNPLYVIDGVPSDASDFNNLGQNDIKDISILKGASAAIYGLRASNGVILVTTKSGGYDTGTDVSVSGYYGWQQFTRYPRPANAYQHIRGKIYSAQNYGNVLPYSQETLNKWKQGGGDYKSYNYYDQVMGANVPQWQLNARVSGGSENVSYYLSATQLTEKALVKDFNWKRTNIQANVEGKLSDKLTVGGNIKARIEDRHNVGVPGYDDYFNPFLSIFSMWPTESPYANDNPNYVHQTHNINVNPATYDENITGYVNEIHRSTDVKLYAQYDFDFGLSLKGTGSYNFTSLMFDGFEYTYDAYKYDEETDTYYTQPSWGNNNPWREQRTNPVRDRFVKIQANYNKQFKGHEISLLAAYERQDHHNNWMQINSTPSNNYIPIMDFANLSWINHDIGKSARAGYVGRVNYNYKEKYIFEVLGRYDGSFLFPKDERWGLFPAVSAGWRISEEPFFENVVGDVVTNLKIRASYGKTGSDTWGDGSWLIDPFSYRSGYNYGNGSSIFNGSNVTGLEPIARPVRNLSWIENINKDLGFDLSMFNDKLSFSMDIFERRREGLPAPRYDVQLPAEVGYNLPPENLESDAVRGVEGSVSYNGQINNDLKFTIGANATAARQRTLDRYKPRYGNSWDKYRTATENRWSNITWGYQVIGRFQSQEQIEDYPVNIDGQGNRTLLPGDFIYKDVNGDGIIDGLDERPIAYAMFWDGPQPIINFGINGSFSWKGLTLNYSFAGGTTYSFMRDFEMRYPFQNNGTATQKMMTDRWHRADPFDPNSEWIPGDYPATRATDYGHSNYRVNNYWVSNVHYIRLRNLGLSYQLPQTLLKRVGMDKLRVYAKATNLFSLDNLKDYSIDPEVASRNALQYPQQTMISFGFNVTL